MPDLVPQTVYSDVEPLGGVPLVPGGDLVELEFVCEVLRVHDAVVDTTTLAVFAHDGDRLAPVELSWLLPRDQQAPDEPIESGYLEDAVVVPLDHPENLFFVLMHTAAALHVLGRARLLIGRRVVGWLPVDSHELLVDALLSYGCVLRPRPRRASRFVRVGTLDVPRFWVRPAGSDGGHFDAPEWSAQGYSRRHIAALRARVAPVEDAAWLPETSPLAYDARTGAAVRADRSGAAGSCAAQGIPVLPPLSGLGLVEQAAYFARLRAGLVAIHGDDLANVVFMPPSSQLVEVFVDGYAPGQFSLLAALAGIGYRPVTVAAAEAPEPLAPEDRSPQIDHQVTDALAGLASALPKPVRSLPPISIVTTSPPEALDPLWFETWIEHHLDLGIGSVLVAVPGDGSQRDDIGRRWRGRVRSIDAGTDADPLALLAACRAETDQGWAMLLDVEEFVVCGSAGLAAPQLVGALDLADLVTLPTYDVTAVSSAADDGLGLSDLTLRRTIRVRSVPLVRLDSDVVPGLPSVRRAAADVIDADLTVLRAPAGTSRLAGPQTGQPVDVASLVADERLYEVLADGVVVRDSRLALAARRARRQG